MLSARFIARRATVLSESVEALGVQRHKYMALQASTSGVVANHGVNSNKKGTPWAPRSICKHDDSLGIRQSGKLPRGGELLDVRLCCLHPRSVGM